MAKQGWSPSQQEGNQYAGGGTGYSDSEQYWMELLSAETHKQWVEQQTGIPDVVFEKETWQLNTKASNDAGVTHHVAQHTNAGGGRGCEIFHHPSSVEGKRMAQILFKHISAVTDVPDRAVKASDAYGELNDTRAKAVIVEYDFHDSTAGAAEIRRSIKEYATATVKAMCEYHGKPYRATAPAPVTPPAPPLPSQDVHLKEIAALKATNIELTRQLDSWKITLENLKARVRNALEG